MGDSSRARPGSRLGLPLPSNLYCAEDPELVRMLSRAVDELELSVRAANCLKAANIRTIGALVAREESEMLQFHNFGKKSLDEIKSLLESMGLTLGMKVPASVLTLAEEEAPSSEVSEEE